MGCSSSRIDDIPAVALCLRRRKSLDDAVKHLATLAASQSSYSNSLTALSDSLLHSLTQFPPISKNQNRVPPENADFGQSKPNSDSGHIQFTPSSDDENQERKIGNSTASNSTYGGSYGYLNGSVDGFGRFLVSGNDMPPPPPPAGGLTWDLMNFFAPYDISMHFQQSHDTWQESVRNDEELEAVQVMKNKTDCEAEEEKQRCDWKKCVVKGGGAGKKGADLCKVENEKMMRDASEVLAEVKVEFERAAKAGNGVLKILKAEADEGYVFELDSPEKANLLSILRKLSIWEHKLYAEVKVEEEMRMKHEELQKRLKKQDEKGSEAQKALTSLAPKMKIAFEMVDRISIVSSKLMDEELWPCLKELIQELLVMWVALQDCHKKQVQSISKAARLHNFPLEGEVSNTQVEAAIQLKLEFQRWIVGLFNWIVAQKGFVKCLNKWLQRCLEQEPKENSDAGEETYSRSELGAPMIFVACQQWSQAMKKIKEGEVIEAMQACLLPMNKLLERVDGNIQQRMIIDRDLEKRVRTMETEEKEMLRVLEGSKKNSMKMLPPATSGAIVPSEAPKTDCSNLQPALKRTFEYLEVFTANCVQVYQDLCVKADKLTLSSATKD